MEQITLGEIWAIVGAAAAAIVLLAQAAEKIAKVIHIAKAPNTRQDERLEALETWQESVNAMLSRDKRRLDTFEEGNRASQQALLALLDHGIDGNNIEQMQDAKKVLQKYLINR